MEAIKQRTCRTSFPKTRALNLLLLIENIVLSFFVEIYYNPKPLRVQQNKDQPETMTLGNSFMAHKPSKHSAANKGIHFASHRHVAAIPLDAIFIALPSTTEMPPTFLKSLPSTRINDNKRTNEMFKSVWYSLCEVGSKESLFWLSSSFSGVLGFLWQVTVNTQSCLSGTAPASSSAYNLLRLLWCLLRLTLSSSSLPREFQGLVSLCRVTPKTEQHAPGVMMKLVLSLHLSVVVYYYCQLRRILNLPVAACYKSIFYR